MTDDATPRVGAVRWVLRRLFRYDRFDTFIFGLMLGAMIALSYFVATLAATRIQP